MINTVIFNNEIKVWWEYVKLYDNNSFVVTLNGKEVGRTQKSHFNIKGLSPCSEYEINVNLIDESGKIKQCVGNTCVITAMEKRKIDITKPPYCAIPDGKTLNTLAIQNAINDCSENDYVFFPDGIYLTGAINLKSNIELLLADNAVIQGSFDPKDYLPKIESRFEGYVESCYRSLLNAGAFDEKGGINCENITIRGGKIYGGGQQLRANIINAEKEPILKEYGFENEINPPYFYSSVLPGRKRGRLFGFSNVQNVIIANTEVGNSPSWNLHFTYCENVITCGCIITSHGISNGDGWDPDSSKNCVVFDTCFDTGDDCVAIKSGKNLEGYLIGRPCEHIRIFDIETVDGHGIAIGSEMSGGVNDVVIWNCCIPYGTGIYIKSQKKRGGYVKNVKVYNCSTPSISIHSSYGVNNDGEPAPNPPEISDMIFEDITVTGVSLFTNDHERVEPETAVSVSGLDKEHPIKNVTLKNITLKYRSMMPYQSVYLSNVEGVKLENVVCLGEI